MRSADDKRRYDLEGLGWLQGGSWLKLSAEASTPSGGWSFEAKGWSGGRAEATSSRSGAVEGRYERTSAWSHRGVITWFGQSYDFVKTSTWRYRFQLLQDEVTLLEIEANFSQKKPAVARLEEGADIDPGLVFFAVWLTRLFVAQDSAAT